MRIELENTTEIKHEVKPRLVIKFIQVPITDLQGLEIVFDLSVLKELSIGRSPENTIVIPDPTVSRKHAVLTFDGEKLVLKDLGSTNGTYVLLNNVFQKVNEFVVESDVLVRFGYYTITKLSLFK